MAATNLASPWILRRASQAVAFSHHLPANNNLSYCKILLSLPSRILRSSSAPGICHVVQAAEGDIDALLKGVNEKSATEEVKHILDMAKRASSRREVLHTNFLTPPVLKESMLALEKLADLKAVVQGGYPQVLPSSP